MRVMRPNEKKLSHRCGYELASLSTTIYQPSTFSVQWPAVGSIAWLGLGEHGVDVRDEPRREANLFGFAPPALATRRSEQGAQECSTCRFESPLRKNSALRSIPNVKSRPGVFLQHLLQSKLIGGIQRAFPLKAGGHQLGDVAVLGDRLADHRPLFHRRVVFGALEGAGILLDL